ncbi:uncharacterized protein LOC118421148 [Branchiostoma floridae]|uniref:Uncharacterized protein LOC118421148 n=1 Tax=Branchiostoma floridae TaxID=7739 RepID=A0A9J7LJW3_BRAFL|nr:uncharacterized protein LOC118421148 [Branchiostoma floridae]
MVRRRIDAFCAVLLVSVAFVCGQQSATLIVLQAERHEGNFTSPGFPNNYPNNTNMTWRIEADSDDVVHLKFVRFDLEGIFFCLWDYVVVHGSINDPETFCGIVVPKEMISISNVLSVDFISDDSESRPGFFARYWATPKGNFVNHTVPPEFDKHCKGLNFDWVTFPNFYGHESDQDVLTSRQWEEMVSVNISCHPQVQRFLCALLMPRWLAGSKQLPCQSWCQEVRSACSSAATDWTLPDACPFNTTECVNLEPAEASKDCYFGKGENYRGKETRPENKCLHWTSPDALGPMEARDNWDNLQENYCRNFLPDESSEPFCFVKEVWDENQTVVLREPCGLMPCNERGRGCGVPPVVVSGSRSPVYNFYRIGDHVDISCDVGFSMEEEDMWMTCIGNENWSKTNPTCKVDHRLLLAKTLLHPKRYNPELAPSRKQVNVTFEGVAVDIIDADAKNEDMFSAIAFRLHWTDNRLSWTSKQNDNVRNISVSRKRVWTPKVYLHPNGDARFRDFSDATVTVTSDGLVEWTIIDVVTTTCELDSALFPFDTMGCDVCLRVDTRLVRFGCAENVTEFKPLIESFMTCDSDGRAEEVNQWWAKWKVNVKDGLACINMTFDRNPTADFCTTLSPVIILSVLMCIIFVLPVDKGDRLSFGMTILLSMVVSLVFISDVLPTKGSMPVIGKLVIVYMCMMGVFVIYSLIVIRISSRKKDLPPVVKKVFLGHLARLVFLGDLTKPTRRPTVVNVHDIEMVEGLMVKDSKPSEAEPESVEVLLSLQSQKVSKSCRGVPWDLNALSDAVESLGPRANPKPLRRRKMLLRRRTTTSLLRSWTVSVSPCMCSD